MKPNQHHKDPRITNISFDNFTGSICIISPISDDEETKDLMLSSPQTNGVGDLFKPNHHLALITQPVLGARSRKKDKIDSLTNSRRSSYNDSPPFILPNNRIEKIPYEKKNSHHESSDSGLDFSLSTNSSVQYPQQYATIHRPLSALNEDSNTDDGFHDQSIRFPVVNRERNRSMENIINDNKHQQKNRSDTITEFHPQMNLNKIEFLHPPPIRQHQSLNDLTNQTLTVIPKQNKPLRKKTKLNIIVEPSSHLTVNDQQIHSISRTTSSLSNHTISHLIRSENQQIKPKAITPLGHYPNQEQIRAHINRSVIERQHPSYLPNPSRKGLIQQMIPFDASPSKLNNPLFRQQKQSMNHFHSNPNIQGGGLDAFIAPSRQIKRTLPSLYNEEIIDDRREKRNQKEKRHLNDINKSQENSQKEQVQIKVKDMQELLKINQKRESRQDQMEHFLTSTPRRHYKQGNFKQDQSNDTILKKQNINRLQQPSNPTHRSKPSDLVIQNKNRVVNPNTEFESPRNVILPFQFRPRKLNRTPNIQSQTEQNQQFNERQKSPTESMNSLLRTTRIQPMNINNIRRENEINRLSKMSLTQLNKPQNNANPFFPARSPTSWSLISDHPIKQQEYDHYESSSSSPRNELITNDKSTHNYRLIIIDKQQPLDGRYVIPANNSQLPVLIDTASQTSSRHTHPFTCTTDFNNISDVSVGNSPCEFHAPDNTENIFAHRSFTSSSLDRLSPNGRFPLLLGKMTVSKKDDDIATNYDSDDGWSDDSAELIYADERYTRQKKKK